MSSKHWSLENTSFLTEQGRMDPQRGGCKPPPRVGCCCARLAEDLDTGSSPAVWGRGHMDRQGMETRGP